MAINNARDLLSDKIVRVAKPHRILDPAHGPLIAVRLNILTRKTLGGLETNLDSQVDAPRRHPVPRPVRRGRGRRVRRRRRARLQRARGHLPRRLHLLGPRGRAGVAMTRLQMYDEGPATGQPLLMVHGFIASSAWFDEIVPLLPGYRVIRVDLLGHGGSDHPETGYGPEDNARLAAEVLDRLALENVVVVGHSMGCHTAVALAERSKRVTGLVLLSEGPARETAYIPRVERLAHVPVLGPFIKAISPAPAIRQAMRLAFAPGFRISKALGDLAVRDYRAMSHRSFSRSLLDRAAYLERAPLDTRLRALGLPVLVVFGDRDRLHRVAQSVARYREVPGLRVEIVEGAGHTTAVEAPERTAHLIDEFARSVG